MLEKFNKVLDKNFTSESELIEFLNDEFLEYYESLGDIQSAFDLLNDETKKLLGSYFCWSIGDWDIELNIPKAEESIVFQKLNQWAVFYDWDEFVAQLKVQIEDDECNVGIDPYNALKLEVTDLLSRTGIDFSKYITIVAPINLQLEKVE